MISQEKLYSAYNTTFRISPSLKKCYSRYIKGLRKTVMSLYYSRDFNTFKNKVPLIRRHQGCTNNGSIQITKRPMSHPSNSNIRGIYF
ncbi:hypothetical protein C922_05091 [Plasmodium inui San Antonio 1]|uniref:Uncharacterized protein n=1 Tax=Plasmodium inui San Antonio 1 TaxID=1237626 RepID=W7A643_9APIC|nr:hypothetical protein C922_05091 [Plasmodium inui San Antonio 1]EUD64529.1 hypothetical protein C922_05091 [Plasmodium inui San Antonio 1]